MISVRLIRDCADVLMVLTVALSAKNWRHLLTVEGHRLRHQQQDLKDLPSQESQNRNVRRSLLCALPIDPFSIHGLILPFFVQV